MSQFQLILGNKVRQANAQFIAWQNLALTNRLAVHKRPMTRAQVANKQHAIHRKQVTMLPTEPAIVDAHHRLRSAAQGDWKRLDNDFALRSQRITANEAQFHSVAAIGRQSGFGRKPAIPFKCPRGLSIAHAKPALSHVKTLFYISVHFLSSQKMFSSSAPLHPHPQAMVSDCWTGQAA